MLAEEVLAELQQDLPPVVLLRGHLSQISEIEGICRRVLLEHGMLLSDLRWSRKLTAEVARVVAEEAAVQPSGRFLGFVLYLDGATEQAQNILLKLLEEPPGACRFLLLSSGRPLPALVSRCRSYKVHAAGSEAAEDGNAVAAAAAAVRAAITRDPAALSGALRSWGDRCTCRQGKPHDKGDHYVKALSSWAVSQYRTDMLEPGSLPPVVNPAAARVVLKVLSEYPRARSFNVAAAALSLAFLEEK